MARWDEQAARRLEARKARRSERHQAIVDHVLQAIALLTVHQGEDQADGYSREMSQVSVKLDEARLWLTLADRRRGD